MAASPPSYANVNPGLRFRYKVAESLRHYLEGSDSAPKAMAYFRWFDPTKDASRCDSFAVS
jgi:hypothetical protein